MSIPFEFLLLPIILVAVWLYWKTQSQKRKSASLKGHQDVMNQAELQEFLSTKGRRLAKKGSECERSGNKTSLRNWSPF